MLPVQIIVDTHKALNDWRFTTQEANQIIASVWEAAVGTIVFAALSSVFVVAIKKEPKEELESLQGEISKSAAILHSLEESAAHAREHFSKLMTIYGYGVIPSEMEMRQHHDMKVAKARWDTLEKRAESKRGWLFKLVRRRKELTGEA